MNQKEKAERFASLHRKGEPVILYNVWDPGSTRTVTEAGAKAIATGSWPLAAAHGFEDGEKIPLDLLAAVATSIVAATDLPVSIDFESGYSQDPAETARNVSKIIDTGAIGINFEDQIVGGTGLHPISAQAARIRAIRQMADHRNMPLFINSRTDLFLKEPDASKHQGLLDEAIERAKAYAQAGASGFFAPALVDPELIRRLCAECPLPVNIIMKPGAPDVATLAGLGVARISHGPFPYRQMMAAFLESARAALGTSAG